MSKRWIGVGLTVCAPWPIAAACSTPAAPSGPRPLAIQPRRQRAGGRRNARCAPTGTPDDKGYLDGWFEGGDVQLYYTKSYYCAEPPSSGAASGCEIGAPPLDAPRPGPIPTIYAIAAAGFVPPLERQPAARERRA